MKLKKILSILLAVAMTASLMAGCGQTPASSSSAASSSAPASSAPASSAPASSAASSSSAPAQKEKVHLVFWDENPGTVQTPCFQGILSKFKSDTITVEYVGIPWDSAKEKYDVAIASNATPDIASINNEWLGEYSLKGALVALDSYFSAWDESKQYNTALMDSVKGLAQDKKLYTLPYTDNMPIFWYRADLLKAKGINPPTTWDEIFAAAKALTDSKGGKYGFAIRGGAGGTSQILQEIVAYSGMTSYFDDSGKCLLNNDKAVEFMTKFAAMYNVDTSASDITAGLGETVSAFDSGVAAMMFHNLGSYGDHIAVLKQDQFAGVPLPASVNGKKVYNGGMWCGYAIFTGTKHADECWELMKHMGSKESVSAYNEAIGQLPTRADVKDEAWLQKAPHILAAMKYASDPDTVSVNPPIFLPNFSDVKADMVQKMQDMLAGNLKPKEFLDEYAAALEAGYKQLKS